MATTLVQTTTARPTTATSRPSSHSSSSSYPNPIGRPSSASASSTPQRQSALYLVTSQQPHQQPIFVPPPAQQAPFTNYDFTRQTKQTQQAAKQAAHLQKLHHLQMQQQQRQYSRQHPQQTTSNSAPPTPRAPHTIQHRSRSEETLRERSRLQSSITLQSSVVPVSQAQEAQSAPRPASSAFLRSPSTADLPPLPAMQSAPPPRPSSADGTTSSRPTASMVETYRSRAYIDSRVRYAAATRESIMSPVPTPPPMPFVHTIQPRYSAEDVATLKSLGYQPGVGIHSAGSGHPIQQVAIQPQFQPQTTFVLPHRQSKALTLQPVVQYRAQQQQVPPQPTFALPQQSHRSPTRTQHPSPTPATTKSSPTRPQMPQSPVQRTAQSPPRPQSSPQQSPTRPSSQQRTSPEIPPQIPALPPHIHLHQSSLPPQIRREIRLLQGRSDEDGPQIKRIASYPELPPSSLRTAAHRKSSSSSSTSSAASAPSQLETSSTHSSIPSSHSSVPSSEQHHSPLVPSPLGKVTDEEPTAPEINIVPPSSPSPEPELPPTAPLVIQRVNKRRSISSRLRRAFSFSGSIAKLSSSVSTPDLHAAHSNHEYTSDGDEEGGVDNSDRASISSTASSASILLRSISSGLRKSRKGIMEIFRGSRRRMGGSSSLGEDDDLEEEQEDKFPFGVPGEEASVGMCYATAEGEMSTDERRKSMIFADREASTMTRQIKKGKGNKGKAKDRIVPVRGILKSPPSPPRLSLFVSNEQERTVKTHPLNMFKPAQQIPSPPLNPPSLPHHSPTLQNPSPQPSTHTCPPSPTPRPHPRLNSPPNQPKTNTLISRQRVRRAAEKW